MGQDDFIAGFQRQFYTIYLQCFRRLSSENARLTPQTMAVLEHLAQTGPLTAQETAKHFGRAQSTVSEMVERMVSNGLLERRKDPKDGRKALIWLSALGMNKWQEGRTPLDPELLAPMAERLTQDEQRQFLHLFAKLTDGGKNEM